MFDEIGRYSGTVLFPMEAGQHSVVLKIESNGRWTIIVKLIAQGRAWNPAEPANGKADDVLLVSSASSRLAVVTLNRSGFSHFAIVGYNDQGSDLLVNEIIRYAGQMTLPDGVLLLATTADGAWTVAPA